MCFSFGQDLPSRICFAVNDYPVANMFLEKKKKEHLQGVPIKTKRK